MLSARPTNTNVSDDLLKQAKGKTGRAKSNQNKLQNTINTKKGGGLKVADPNRVPLASKPKPLHASTNTIHSQQQKLPTNNLKCDKNIKAEDDLMKKKGQSTSSSDKPKIEVKVDENDVSPFVTNPYNPLQEICPFDEELYQKVLKLEIADDGFPVFDTNEPFDF